MSSFRHLAPAGAPIGLLDLVRATGLALSHESAEDALRRALIERFGVRDCFLTATGRAGMTLLLRALRRVGAASRDEIVLPSYTCFSVAAAVVKAGLRPRVVDVDPETLDYAPERLRTTDFTRVLAIVATNLYGLPNDMPALVRLARDRGAFLVDDAAQAMGASVEGRWSGTWGDAGLFSFDKGKNVAAIDGGAVVTSSSQIASALAEEIGNMPPAPARKAAVGVAKAFAYSVLLHPRFYWMPARVPQLGLGRTEFTTEFPLEAPSRPLVALAARMLTHLDAFTRIRQANASALQEALRDVPGVRGVAVRNGVMPVYLRLPILVTEAEARDRVLTALVEQGIGASCSYPASLVDVPGLQGLLGRSLPAGQGGRSVARRIVTLPTHAFVTAEDIHRTVDIIAKTLATPVTRTSSPAA